MAVGVWERAGSLLVSLCGWAAGSRHHRLVNHPPPLKVYTFIRALVRWCCFFDGAGKETLIEFEGAVGVAAECNKGAHLYCWNTKQHNYLNIAKVPRQDQTSPAFLSPPLFPCLCSSSGPVASFKRSSSQQSPWSRFHLLAFSLQFPPSGCFPHDLEVFAFRIS